MTRILIYFVAWVGLVPWLASVFWLTMERLKSQPDYGVLNAASDAALGGLFGLMFSILVTAPLSASLLLFLKLLPKVARMNAVRVLVSLILSLVAGVWALWLVTDGGFESLHLTAFLVGGISGLALAMFSYLALPR
ncbi:MAG TPA: hypothetical protein PKI20_21540 [Verrucomicrobiota bacterium]|jgi:hypothetical protein|nr:hypothetical protein [Verrucomicrobiota bacterium]